MVCICLSNGGTDKTDITSTAVITAYPKCSAESRKVVDCENAHLNMPYLSVAENILRYLAHHKTISPEDALAGEKNIQDMIRSVHVFVRFPAWKGKRSRLQYVLWELHDSAIIRLLFALREDLHLKDLVPARLVRALRELLELIDAELMSDSWLREFWKDKFDSVEGSLQSLEGTFNDQDLEVQDSDHETLCPGGNGVRVCKLSFLLLTFFPLHPRLGWRRHANHIPTTSRTSIIS